LISRSIAPIPRRAECRSQTAQSDGSYRRAHDGYRCRCLPRPAENPPDGSSSYCEDLHGVDSKSVGGFGHDPTPISRSACRYFPARASAAHGIIGIIEPSCEGVREPCRLPDHRGGPLSKR
jgi:hypothetical protein